ncbi:MAG: hypothetical protein AB7N91_25825 [Candidatus Tectimicrobiota bacterium]
MLALSQGASMAWQLAAREAARAQQRYIERESVFLGICQLGTRLRAAAPGTAGFSSGKVPGRSGLAEAETVEELLGTHALTPKILCRAVRTAVGRGNHGHGSEAVVHRSQACKTCFQRASALAASAHAREIHCLHLLAALLEHPGAVLTGVLGVFRVDCKALQAQIMATVFALDAIHARAANKGQGVSHLIYVGGDGQR